jgi:hypothetical protein
MKPFKHDAVHSTYCPSPVTSGFIDMACRDKLEDEMYHNSRIQQDRICTLICKQFYKRDHYKLLRQPKLLRDTIIYKKLENGGVLTNKEANQYRQPKHREIRDSNIS